MFLTVGRKEICPLSRLNKMGMPSRKMGIGELRVVKISRKNSKLHISIWQKRVARLQKGEKIREKGGWRGEKGCQEGEKKGKREGRKRDGE